MCVFVYMYIFRKLSTFCIIDSISTINHRTLRSDQIKSDLLLLGC